MTPMSQPGTFSRLSKCGGIIVPASVAATTMINDTIWAAKGDLVVGTGADTAAVLSVTTTAGQTLVKDSAAATGLAWATSWWASRMPTGAISETTSRKGMEDLSSQGLTSQELFLVAIYLPVDATITSISFVSAATAAGTPTNWWFALYDSSRNLLRQTADQTTTAWAANTLKTVNLTSTYTTTVEGLYYIGIMMKATTPISVHRRNVGVAAASLALTQLAPILAGASSTGLTDTAPNPAAAITADDSIFYGYCS